jgi:hypothetical protein
MMRLVLRYTYGDGFTYSASRTEPIEYESAEVLIVHFMDAATEAMKGSGWFQFAGGAYAAQHFFELLESPESAAALRPEERLVVGGRAYLIVHPHVMTLDEWYASQPTST